MTYSRSEIVNHFGAQYDSARHNVGVRRFEPRQFALIPKLDTSSWKAAHQYTNRIVDLEHPFTLRFEQPFMNAVRCALGA